MQKTSRWFGGAGHDCANRREDREDSAGAADVARRELDPQLLAQLRDLQSWAIQTHRRDEGSSEVGSARGASEIRREAAREAAGPAGTSRHDGPPPQAPRHGIAAVPPPTMTKGPSRAGRWTAIAALALLVALDFHLMRRNSQTSEPTGATAATAAGQSAASRTAPTAPVIAPAPAVMPPRRVVPAESSAAPAVTPPSRVLPAESSAPPATPSPTAPRSAPAVPVHAAADQAPVGAQAPPAAAAVGQRGDGSALDAPASRHGSLLRSGRGVRPPMLLTVPRVHRATLARRGRTKDGLVETLARRLGLRSRIQLAVLVDESGRVTAARLAGGDTSRAELDHAALSAAWEARFRPATRNGVPGKMWTRLTFDFGR